MAIIESLISKTVFTRFLISAILTLATCVPMAAEEVGQMAPFTASPQELLKAEIKSKIAEGTRVIVLSEEWTYSVDTTGRRKTHLHRIYKVLTQAGVNGWDSTGWRWEPWHEDRPVFRARVITADGAVHELEEKTIAEMPIDE